MSTIVILDNYDSFTYNLVQILGSLCADRFELEVVRNDQTDLNTIQQKSPALVVVSPGPGRPEAAGISIELMGAPEL